MGRRRTHQAPRRDGAGPAFVRDREQDPDRRLAGVTRARRDGRPRRSRAAGARAAVRWARVLTARARVAAGYYERSDVQALVISAVISQLRPR